MHEIDIYIGKNMVPHGHLTMDESHRDICDSKYIAMVSGLLGLVLEDAGFNLASFDINFKVDHGVDECFNLVFLNSRPPVEAIEVLADFGSTINHVCTLTRDMASDVLCGMDITKVARSVDNNSYLH